MELLLQPRARGLGRWGEVLQRLQPALYPHSELTQPARSCVSCPLAHRKSPGNLAPDHPNAFCRNGLDSPPQSSIFFSYLNAALFPLIMKTDFVNCQTSIK